MKRLGLIYLVVGFLGRLAAQGLTGQISGTVRDQGGALVTQAVVELTQVETSAKRNTTSDANGAFTFPELLRGTYTVDITAPGFKRYKQQSVVLNATERLVLNNLVLEIGDVQQSISVSSDPVRVQTQSAERAGLLSTEQLRDLPARGRDVLDFMRALPGIVDTGVRESPGATGTISSLSVNGFRQGTMNFTLDGVSDLDIGSMAGILIDPNVDSIAEVKVLVGGLQAEYGRSSGATINIITKSGGKTFHGSASEYVKNEALNANDFFNNTVGLKRPLYRYYYSTFTVGGPVLMPFTKFNRGRDRLFFFWSNDYSPVKSPTALLQRTYPTALERQGDFSQTFDTTGKIIPIIDPLTHAQFPGNIVPASRIDKNGQGLLNVFPLPNTVDPTHNFNAYVQGTVLAPRTQENLRLDYNLGAKTNFFIRGVFGHENNEGPLGSTLGSGSWPQLDVNFKTFKRGVTADLIHTFSPTVVNEFTFGVNYNLSQNGVTSQQTLDANNFAKLGLNIPEFNPSINPNSILPQVTFGGVPNAASLSVEQRFPYFGAFYIYNISDNISKVYGPHNFKAGIYVDYDINNKAINNNFNGTYDFSRNTNNPLDTNYAYSNALLGEVNSYSQTSSRPVGYGRFSNIEWFLQDNWKVTKKLTLDIGLRFYKTIPVYSVNQQFASFSPALYQASQQPQLIRPVLAPNGVRSGLNPVTGELVPAVEIGLFAPGSGTPYQGMEMSKQNLLHTPGLQYSPRFGFAYDPFGNGRTAIRGSFAIMPDVTPIDMSLNFEVSPPLVTTNTVFYTPLNSILSSGHLNGPNNVMGIQKDFTPQTLYNWNMGVQQNIGAGIVLDVAYVGTRGRHLLQSRNLNAEPYGTNFLASSQDPTLPGKPLPVNFLRPYLGYGDITYIEFGGSSNYNALQVTANRRMSRSVQLGLSYAWSKYLTYGLAGDNYTDVVNPFIAPRIRSYGPAAFDRRNNLTLNFVYDVPKGSQLWNNAFTRAALDNWDVSGFATFRSGAPTGISYSFVNAVDITGAGGAGVDSRVNLTGPVNLAKSDQTFSHFFNTANVAAPSAANFGIGNASKFPLVGPGINDWDMQFGKAFTFSQHERFHLQFQAAFYNIFNHTQFSGVNTAARFDASGNQVNNQFGQFISAYSGRRAQVGAKFRF